MVTPRSRSTTREALTSPGWNMQAMERGCWPATFQPTELPGLWHKWPPERGRIWVIRESCAPGTKRGSRETRIRKRRRQSLASKYVRNFTQRSQRNRREDQARTGSFDKVLILSAVPLRSLREIVLSGPVQNIYLSANCMMRGFPNTVILPNVDGVLMLAFGLVGSGWFRRLKASARNWSRCLSLIRTSRT